MKTLERRLVETLRYEAERLPEEEAAHTLSPWKTKRSGFLRPGMAAPAAVVAVMILAAPVIWLSAQRGGGSGPTPATSPTSQPAPADTSTSVASTPPATVPGLAGRLGSMIDQLPDGFDPERASPVFAMDGSLEEIALRYLETRHLPTDVGISQVEEQDGYTLLQWAWGQLLDETQIERGERGWLLMRPASRGYEILAATTDGVDLSDITISDGSLRGTVRSDSDDGIGVDVLDLDETPVASAPNPDGMPDADYLWGTAGEGSPPLSLDLPVTDPVILRVNRVGGTLLSISEVILGQNVNDTTAVGGAFGEGNLDEPPFSGDDWQLIVGEGPNPPTDTYKVCHSFAPATGPSEATGFGPSGCVTWPDDATDTIIMDAIPFTTPDGHNLLFVDLTADAFDTLSVALNDGSTLEVAPFAMPGSGKQFAVVELPAGASGAADIQLLDSGTVVESRTINITPTG